MRYTTVHHSRLTLGRRAVLRLMMLGIVGVMSLAGTSPAMAGSQDADSFWTEFTPSADTRLIFVSSSEGSDSNSGLTPAQPVKSLARGYELMRDGYPDWMLLKRGDVWLDSLPSWSKSGRGVEEKMVVGAYGDLPERPKIKTPANTNGLNLVGTSPVNHLAFVGFHMEPASRADGENPRGIRWMRRSNDILFEDLYVAGFKDNITVSGGEGNPVTNVRINGCVVVDSWSPTSHSQGLYASRMQGLVIENCVFASNGFNLDRGATPTIFNHNIYIQHGVEDVVVRDNIIADASSHGIQLRPGGVIERNLFVKNAIHLLISMDEDAVAGDSNNVVRNNLIMYGKDISVDLPRRMAMHVGGLQGAVIAENILYGSRDLASGDAIAVAENNGRDLYDVLVTRNRIVNWNGRLRIGPADGGFNGIRFFDNTVDCNFNSGAGEMFNLFQADHPGVSVASNEYRVSGVSDRPFRVGSRWTDFAEWRTLVETDAEIVQGAEPPPAIGLDVYLASLGRSGDVDAFLDEARTLSRHSSNPHLRPSRIYEWAAQRLGD